MSTVSISQPLQTLAAANKVRIDRAELRADLKHKRITLRAALDDPRAQGMTVSRLLASQHRWGAHRARQACLGVPVSENRLVGDLTGRQREALAQLTEARRNQE